MRYTKSVWDKLAHQLLANLERDGGFRRYDGTELIPAVLPHAYLTC